MRMKYLDICHPCPNPPHPNPQKMKGFEMIVKTTKDDIANWIGNNNLTIDKLLELLCELANEDYRINDFIHDVKDYNIQ